jgi:hypothetical protein
MLRNIFLRAAHIDALHVEKERIQATLDSIGVAEVTPNAAASVTYTHQNGEAASGRSPPEVIDRQLQNALPIKVALSAAPFNPIMTAISPGRPVMATEFAK